MKKRKTKINKVMDADLDNELDQYDVESSDDGLDGDDRILIENARGRKRRQEEEEVLPIHEASSDSESYVDEDGQEENDNSEKSNDDDSSGGSSDMESDIDHKSDGLPDSKAWGSKKKNYYHTDYVDKDYSGFDDEEAAIMEEEEAKAIQQRLLSQLEEADFTMGLLDKVEAKKKEGLMKSVIPEVEEKIETDLSKLSEQELKEFDDRETPGFNKMRDECKNYAKYAQNIICPILEFAEHSRMKNCAALKLIKLKHLMILRYCVNVTFLLRLKSHRTSNIDRHPVIARINKISKYLKEIDDAENGGLKNQMLEIAKILKINGGISEKKIIVDNTLDTEEKEVTGKNRKERRKKMFQLLIEKKKMDKVVEKKEKKLRFADEMGSLPLEDYAKQVEEDDTTDEEAENDEDAANEAEKRAITYQMLKNKGLTPRRKKDVRNPRVRNKNKYKKAVVRRKGQVKMARLELKKYDGEISGIRKNLSKSIKLK